jgi:hypothetical protein
MHFQGGSGMKPICRRAVKSQHLCMPPACESSTTLAEIGSAVGHHEQCGTPHPPAHLLSLPESFLC